jgi:GT2 family glycosyltransferase
MDSPRPTVPGELISADSESSVPVNPTVSIVIVSYNTKQMTLECLRSVFEQTRRTLFEVIVIDNESADGSADAIESEFVGRLRLIRSGSNLGFAKANNVAAEYATGEFLLLLNPDTVVLDGAIDKIVDFARQHRDAGIWGGRTVYPDGTLNPASCWGRQTLWSVFCAASGLSSIFRRSTLFNPEGIGGWKRDSVREVDIVSGCFLLIKREFWNRLGGFDPAFFMYGEEADLCLRSRSYGARPMITPKAVIVHYGGASDRVRADKIVKLLHAKIQLIRKHWTYPSSKYGVLMLSLYPMTRSYVWCAVSFLTKQDCADNWLEVWRRRSEWVRVEQSTERV